MGWSGNHRGSRSKAHNSSSSNNSSEWKPAHHEAAAAAAVLPLAPQRPLAAQWRFACRILRSSAPEERVSDAKRQLRLGDHVLIRYSWDNSEQHGIISSAGEGRRERQDPHWVTHWDGSRLQCSPLSQLAKGGEVARILYPHWACRILPPATSTARPQVLEERLLEAAADQAVAQRATSAARNSWAPRWAQSADLEFCLDAKTGGQGPSWELHGRRALSGLPLASLGCQLRGERPSASLGAKAAPGAASAAKGGPPSFQAAAPPPWGTAPAMAAADFEAALHSQEAWNWWSGWAQKGMPGMSPDTSVFMPQAPDWGGPQAPNWDGIYQ